MFSKNNLISKRQIFRLLTYDLLGIGTLLLPAAVAGASGKNGFAAIGIGIAGGILYCFLIGWLVSSMKEKESYPAFLKRSFGAVIGTAALVFYVLYFLCLGGYSTYIFGHLMITELLKDQSFYWITAGILLLAVYAVLQGIEGRARIYEILFWFLMGPLFLMLFLASRDVEPPRLFPLYTTAYEGMFTGAYFCFEMFSLSGIALFLTPFARKKQSVRGACIAAVLFSGLVFLVLYVILQGIFGIAEIKDLEYPAVTLMSMIQIPGGFLERQDSLMVAIWFYTVFALQSSSMFYTAECLKEFTKGKKKWWIVIAAAAFFGISVYSYRSAEFTGFLHQAFLYAATPLAVLIPLAAGLCSLFRTKGRQMIHCAVLFLAVTLLSGCSTQELENRKFPLAMGVDKEENACRVSYKFQDLSSVADENAESAGGTDFYIEDTDFFTGISKYANDTNKILDYNHMKALILSKDFVEDWNALIGFLEVCGKESLIARNTLLFFAEDSAKILNLDKNLDASIGSYLEEMMESREDYKLRDAVTMGDLYNDLANKEQLLLVPVLSAEGGLPIIRSYYAISFGSPKGEIGVNEAALSYLCQGKMEKLSFSLDKETAVQVNRIRVREDFSKGEEICCNTKIRMEIVVEKELDTKSSEGRRIKKEIEDLFLEQLAENAENLLRAPKIDMTDSFYKLGMHGRNYYEAYNGNPEKYLEELRHKFEVEVILLNERG